MLSNVSRFKLYRQEINSFIKQPIRTIKKTVESILNKH